MEEEVQTVIPTPAVKLAQTAALVTPFQYNPYMNGARNAPASAPQEIPISCAMNVGGSIAITTDNTMKNTTITCMVRTCFFSLISFITLSLRNPKSMSSWMSIPAKPGLTWKPIIPALLQYRSGYPEVLITYVE